MNVAEFIDKWKRSELTERSAAQQHFLDLCSVFDHPTPAEIDPAGEHFTFEKGAEKKTGADGWADVWKKGYFAWEYKGKHKDLEKAYLQLDDYRAALGNPPLLVTCDMDRFEVHTNFTNTDHVVHRIPLAEMGEPRHLEILRAVFHAPHKLKPGTTSEAITAEAASRVGEVAIALRERGLDPHRVAHFLDRVVFSFFAEDVGLLPEKLLTRMLEQLRKKPEIFAARMQELFGAMREGGYFGVEEIRRFNGNLFDSGDALDLLASEIERLYQAARLDWSAIDPSILGTLFERGLDPDKRSQLGAHYTSREDIETLVEPVVMKPLRREWNEVQELVTNLLTTGKKSPKETDREKPPPTGRKRKQVEGEAQIFLRRFHQKLAQVKVLDPACGSGNFLYVTLQKLKDLEKEVILFAMDKGFPGEIPLVGPWQLHGIEINPYAYELAQMTVWIGYLQWIQKFGFGTWDDPILRKMDTFECKDAILDLSDPEAPKEPTWPKVDFIVGNPPFLGGKKMRSELGDEYVDALFGLWDGRVPREADLVVYWFEKARKQIEKGRVDRVGLLATQGIRGGANREVLKRIKETGEIFFAESDRNWVLDGAAVHVSMIGYGRSVNGPAVLDGREVEKIHSNLTGVVDLTQAQRLGEKRDQAFMADTKGGAFDLDPDLALEMLRDPNPHGRPNSDVIVPWVNGSDLTKRRRGVFIIDFGAERAEDDAAQFEQPYEHIKTHVYPARSKNKRQSYRELWWIHAEPRPAMRAALSPLDRFLATPTVSKYRLFVWMERPTLPDHQLIAFPMDQDFQLGVLHSRFHELWALRQGTRLETRPRYTPTTCFETFPFPHPTPDQEAAIAEAARELDALRERWLNPPEWTKEEVLEFPGSADGPWARYVHDPDEVGIGTVRYPRIVAKDTESEAKLAKRTLTNLYNQRPTWLDHAHAKLDEAVAAAYGWPADLTDDQILERLLALNLERAGDG